MRLHCAGLVLALAVSALSQPATDAQRAGVPAKSGYGTLHLRSEVGSFRLIDGVGRLEISFSGTLLISQAKQIDKDSKLVLQQEGSFTKEYERDGRIVFHGTGRLVLVASFRAVQWFGTKMSAVWYGAGIARLTGEIDRNLKTGEYWYDDPAKKTPWYPNGATTITLPSAESTAPIPRERKKPQARGG